VGVISPLISLEVMFGRIGSFSGRSLPPLRPKTSAFEFNHPKTPVRSVYSEKVVDHYERPRNIGALDTKDPNVGTGLVGAPACGDVMKLQIRVDDQGNIVEAVFKTFGCGSAIASSSLVTEMIKGKTTDEAQQIRNQDIAKHLSLPPVKLHCSMLAEDAVKAAVRDLKAKREKNLEQNATAST
jgi:Fe-S cluster assembly scaffold IscU